MLNNNIKHKADHWRCKKITFYKVQLEIYKTYINALVSFLYKDRHEDNLGKIIR